jgi:hypothetical protein
MIQEKDTLKINNLKNYMRRLFSWEETREDLILEHRLTELYREVRKWEMNHAPNISSGFEDRLFANLKDVSMEEPSWNSRVIPAFLENRSIQYGLSFAMASILAVVLIGRSQTSFLEDNNESAGVVIENTQYLNQPSSVEYADSYHRRVFLESTRNQKGSVETLSNLESYFIATGKNGVASEIRYFIQEVNR